MDQSPVSCRNPHLIGTTFPNVGNVEATDRRNVRVAHGSEGAWRCEVEEVASLETGTVAG